MKKFIKKCADFFLRLAGPDQEESRSEPILRVVPNETDDERAIRYQLMATGHEALTPATERTQDDRQLYSPGQLFLRAINR